MTGKFNIKNFIINPFKYIAGYKALFAGLLFLIGSAVINYYEKIHFDGIIDIHYNPNGGILLYFGEGIFNWLLLAFFLYLGTKIIGNSSYRSIDLFGTQLYARIPFFFASILYVITPVRKFSKYIFWKYLDKGSQVVLTSLDYILLAAGLLLILLIIIYVVYLMYKSYSFVTNMKRKKAVLSFIIIFIIAEFVSKIFFLIFLPVENFGL